MRSSIRFFRSSRTLLLRNQPEVSHLPNGLALQLSSEQWAAIGVLVNTGWLSRERLFPPRYRARRVVVAAGIVTLTDSFRADPIASAIVGLLIIPRTWRLLREAVDVLLESTPKDVDLVDVRKHILEADGVLDVHDLHAWTITSGLNVVSAHVVIGPATDLARVLDELCAYLSEDFDIEHSTFQLETTDRRRIEEASHR